MAQEQEERPEGPRCFVTDAQHGERKRILETWRSRWTAEVCHAFDKPVCGLEAAQGRKEAALTRHCRVSGVAQSLLQRAPAGASNSERYAFAAGHITCGQKCRTSSREVLRARLALCQRYVAEGKTCDHVLELLMPV
jgi:hypothetical protein